MKLTWECKHLDKVGNFFVVWQFPVIYAFKLDNLTTCNNTGMRWWT